MVQKFMVESPGLKSSWLKSLGLKGLGLKLGFDKSRVEMSFTLIDVLSLKITLVIIELQTSQS